MYGILSIAVSRDGEWIVSGMQSGLVMVWNPNTHEQATSCAGHSNWVRAIDVSPDETKIATGSDDGTAYVWSLSTGRRLLGPFKHDSDSWVVAAKFSPDGCLIATVTSEFVWVYHSHWQNGRLIVKVSIQTNSAMNNCLVWANIRQFFCLVS